MTEYHYTSKYYLNTVLRKELNFKGVVISDFGAIDMLANFHRVAKNAFEAGKLAINAGVDIEAPIPFGFGEDFKNAVLSGEISEKLIDKAVFNVLMLKNKLKLFENPYVN